MFRLWGAGGVAVSSVVRVSASRVLRRSKGLGGVSGVEPLDGPAEGVQEFGRGSQGVFRVVVYGRAPTKGSVRAFIPKRADGSLVLRPDGQPVVVKNDQGGRDAEQRMAGIAAACAGEMARLGLGVHGGAVEVEFTVFRLRPKGHHGSGRNAGVLKESAPAFPTARPDVDKHARAIMDALHGVVWRDDSQVVEVLGRKRFGEPERLELAVWLL